MLGIKDLDGQLGAYPYESLKIWYSLTNNITEPLMKRLDVADVHMYLDISIATSHARCPIKNLFYTYVYDWIYTRTLYTLGHYIHWDTIHTRTLYTLGHYIRTLGHYIH